MTPLDDAICWAILAPVSLDDLDRIAAREWAATAPHAVDPPPWQALAGEAGCNALVSRSPGSEGSDRHFAAILSSLAPGRIVYSLWLDPERRQAFAWKEGSDAGMPQVSLDEIAAQCGFSIAPAGMAPEPDISAALVEGATLAEVRGALAEFAGEPWLRLEEGPGGVIVATTAGALGTQPWDVAEALPAATVYYVQRRAQAFEVLVLRGPEQAGLFRIPPFDGDADALADIKGQTEPAAILRALGMPAWIDRLNSTT